ncbi:cytochrome PufQ [Jannaschia aquimarina]|uniref:PufQ cytochrome subunit n=1 Tax=Jannaschia aquimarina TaxID=935700 RepID=A0A0D1EAZ0_9RHOB|nr:cytochrome PufQ [Jannaschia aquimarina]KIT14904.1 PufQ cytochrome subunit [Jannaschia aquimarina]SNS58926.1 PufQ cytochrome subunit [Jannaschia aquimarina]
MADITSQLPSTRQSRGRGPEYWAYFAPVFVLSVPLAAMRAARAVVTSEAAPRQGVLRDAWSRAHEVTATICSV